MTEESYNTKIYEDIGSLKADVKNVQDGLTGVKQDVKDVHKSVDKVHDKLNNMVHVPIKSWERRNKLVDDSLEIHQSQITQNASTIQKIEKHWVFRVADAMTGRMVQTAALILFMAFFAGVFYYGNKINDISAMARDLERKH